MHNIWKNKDSVEVRVKIIPLSKRARERVKQHGPIMILEAEETHKVCVRSLDKTWSCQGTKMHWAGWFTKEEAQVEIVS